MYTRCHTESASLGADRCKVQTWEPKVQTWVSLAILRHVQKHLYFHK